MITYDTDPDVIRGIERVTGERHDPVTGTWMIQPAEEQRGGEHPDWDQAHPGEELPSKPDPELWDPPQDPRFAQDPEPDETNEYSWFEPNCGPGRRPGHVTPLTRERERALQATPPDDDDCGREEMDAAPLYAWCGLAGCGGDLCTCSMRWPPPSGRPSASA